MPIPTPRVSALFLPALLCAAACSAPAETSGTDPTTTTSSTPTSTGDTGSTSTGSDPGAGSSHGEGGLPCSSTGVATEGGQDYTYCVAKPGAVEMKIVEPAAAAGPVHLALYLHGDGAGPYASNLDLRKLAPWTTAHNVLLVSALAPNACAWWLAPSYTTCDPNTPIPNDAIDTTGENAQALEDAIDALRAAWDIADAPILFGGSSGGSIFLSASFLPLFGDKHPGAWALSCGGAPPWTGALAWDPEDPTLTSANKLFFTYGDKDFLVPDVLEAIDFYEGMGLPTDVKVIPETVANGATSHCGNIGGSYSYDQIGRVSEVWSTYLTSE